MTKELIRATTTKIRRAECCVQPDTCPENDYLIRGISVYGDRFAVRVHHRGPRCWVLERGELRSQWLRFGSLQALVAWLEDPTSDADGR